jgi:NadR type nicotinamide-nucleotide adenylyltransferase
MNYTYQKPLSGTTVGVVLGAFCPLHQGHLDLIMQAKKEHEGGCLVIVCGYNGDKGDPLMPFEDRYKYVREFFDNDDLVAVYAINDDELGITGKDSEWDVWLNEFNKIYNIAVENKYIHRVWYVGEPEYKTALNLRNEYAILVDRTQNYISGTMIRNNPLKYWNQIAHTYHRVFSHNILITGTASEGKTTLTKDLGKYFNAPYSYEWARNYISDHCISDWEFKNTDFLAFLQGQYELNESIISSKENKGIFFADTDSLVTKMYAEYYSKDPTCNLSEKDCEIISLAADEYTKKSRWDKIFLLPPHGNFVDDMTRYMEHSDMDSRIGLYEILCDNLKKHNLWGLVEILNKGYYENFMTIKNYVKGIMRDEESK